MDIVLYTWAACAHCQRARELLNERKLAFSERPLDGDKSLRRELARRLGRADMPFALIDGELVGGVPDIARHLDSSLE